MMNDSNLINYGYPSWRQRSSSRPITKNCGLLFMGFLTIPTFNYQTRLHFFSKWRYRPWLRTQSVPLNIKSGSENARLPNLPFSPSLLFSRWASLKSVSSWSLSENPAWPECPGPAHLFLLHELSSYMSRWRTEVEFGFIIWWTSHLKEGRRSSVKKC